MLRTVQEVASSTTSGGTHTSRTIMLAELSSLLAACPSAAMPADYVSAIMDANVLRKRSESTRRRTLRYLRELYALDRRSVLFRALRELWDADEDARALLALECAMTRDPLLRATATTILPAPLGSSIDARVLAAAVDEAFPGSYNEAVRAKIGRNAASSWTQSGHLRGRTTKHRVAALCRPAAVAYALMIGHLAEARGQGLLRTVWGQALDAPDHVLYEQAVSAAQRGWIEFRRAGDVIDVGFSWLLRPAEE
jgi:hypothetical protein